MYIFFIVVQIKNSYIKKNCSAVDISLILTLKLMFDTNQQKR